ncbi:MAG: hypothetical protein HDR09_00190 [Lachnospiraceae bacterium]|nr:hypothetical protein [Lachnospiraceae bacterium]MBD5502206.1 hypothetical protein [Lachnospiraceae bacterium]
MLNIMQLEQSKDLYANYLALKPNNKTIDFTFKVGDKYVAIRTNKRNNRQITAGN